nr:E3 ubiquitin-protein ligase RHA2B-like [Ipomoea batatas]
MFPQSAILNYVVLAASQIKWAWDCLLIQSFCQPPPYKFNVDGAGMSPELGARVFGGESEAVECAVCLCKIEEGEEVGDLRCNHIFHRDCLDRWLATGRNSCPLCRTQVKSTGRRLFDDRYQEIILETPSGWVDVSSAERTSDAPSAQPPIQTSPVEYMLTLQISNLFSFIYLAQANCTFYCAIRFTLKSPYSHLGGTIFRRHYSGNDVGKLA